MDYLKKIFDISKLSFLESRLIIFTGFILLFSPAFIDLYLAHFGKQRFYTYLYFMGLYCSGVLPFFISLLIYKSIRRAIKQVLNTWAYAGLIILPLIIGFIGVLSFDTYGPFFLLLVYLLIWVFHFKCSSHWAIRQIPFERQGQLRLAVIMCTPITLVNIFGINLMQESFLFRGYGRLYFAYHICGLSFALITLLQCLNDLRKPKSKSDQTCSLIEGS